MLHIKLIFVFATGKLLRRNRKKYFVIVYSTTVENEISSLLGGVNNASTLASSLSDMLTIVAEAAI